MTNIQMDGHGRKHIVKKSGKALKWGLLVIFILLLIAGALIGRKFLSFEKTQNEQINTMKGDIQFLQEKLSSNHNVEVIKYSEDEYNYLAIGNSISKHSINDYWWNEIGMAATSEENDYYHIVVEHLLKTRDKVNNYVRNFSVWERLSSDRSIALELMDVYLSAELDLITIQLGENASVLGTFEGDYEELINYIKDKAPKAQIVVVGDFWSNGERDAFKEMAAKNCGVSYASISEIKDAKEYQCGIGTIVYGSDGQSHTIEHAGVAAHPGNNGMRYIAESIISVID